MERKMIVRKYKETDCRERQRFFTKPYIMSTGGITAAGNVKRGRRKSGI